MLFRAVLVSLLAPAAAFGSMCMDQGDLYMDLMVRSPPPVPRGTIDRACND